jgi:nitroreductase/NAD-dependent dihydropyrimidine dehydrogenase PreA subunit
MAKLHVNPEKCSSCGQCAEDCPPRIIALTPAGPRIPPDQEASCYSCQHCLAVCPTGALSILGLNPGDSQSLAGWQADSQGLETLIKARRSVRRYRDENVDPALLERLLDVAGHAPTGVNARQVHLTLVDDREKMARFRAEALAELGQVVRNQGLPEGMGRFAEFSRLWEEQGVDVLFRGAPHLLIASAAPQAVTPVPDCMIALATFDLLAQAHGVGTLWDGIAKAALAELLPGARRRLGLPADHTLGYVMVFGPPAVRYARTVQREALSVHRVA